MGDNNRRARGRNEDRRPSSNTQPALRTSPDQQHQPQTIPRDARRSAEASEPLGRNRCDHEPAQPSAPRTDQPSHSAWGREQPHGQPSSSSSCSSKRSHDDHPCTAERSKFPKCHADSSRGESSTINQQKRAVETIVHSRQPHLVSKQGVEGRAISLVTNYFRTQGPKWTLNTYRVDFIPVITNEMIKRRLIREHRERFNGYLFDGTRIFAINRLDTPLELESELREGGKVTIVIRFTGELSMTDSSSLQVLNLIMKRVLKSLNLQLVRRNYYDAAKRIDIPHHHIELWPGYMTSIRQHEQDILMCVELGTKLMRKETVLQMINTINRNSSSKSSYSAECKEAIIGAIVGAIVLTRYNNRTYRIHEIGFGMAPTDTFATKNGPISYVDYYKTKHELTIKDLKQPLLVSRVTEKLQGGEENVKLIVLIPELCCMTGYSDDMRRNYSLMSAVAEHTRIGPPERVKRLISFNQRLFSEPKCMETFAQWNMTLDTNLVEVPGRVLPIETIKFDNSVTKTYKKGNWTNDLQKARICQPPSSKLTNWFVITPIRYLNNTRNFLVSLRTVTDNMGFRITREPSICPIDDDRKGTYCQELERRAHYNPQLILCVIDNDQSYSAIKKKCCVDRAIPTQCIKARTLTKSGLSVATKVALQMVCKLGGAPWSIVMPLSRLMVIGYDVCRDTEKREKSFGAMVASMDMQKHLEYFSTVSAHTDGGELSNALGSDVIKALHEYRRVEGELPDRILIYRDGVGVGQTQYVYEHEVADIRAKLKAIYDKEMKPVKLAFIIVSKRINTRIFEQDRQACNPPPGTVVDDVITLPERYDFFLISQNVNQDSASPTSYNVFDYSFGMPPGKLQQLTYKMCHLYYNWTGTTRVPAVCQYAKKLAFLTAQYTHQAPSPLWDRSLYFL